MKYRLLPLFISALTLSAVALGFSACKDKPEPPVVTVPDDESFAYAEINENGGVSAYEITGLNGEKSAEIEIPASYKGKPVTKIGDGAFSGNEGVTGVTVPDSVTEIGESAFYNCADLKQVKIGNGVTVIGELAFADCIYLETMSMGNGVKKIGDYAFSQCVELKGFDFPSGLEEIGECAFVACQSLDRVVFGDGLKSIGDCAFGGCTGLDSFIIPDSVTNIGWGVLMFDAGSVGFQAPDVFTNSLTRLVISNSITEIPDYAFSKCNISGVEIGKRVKTIKYSAFYGCGLLESVVIPKSVTKIESYAFYRCGALGTVYYAGTAEEWRDITIGKNGNDIYTADKYFYSATRPTDAGNYWHYVAGEPVKW